MTDPDADPDRDRHRRPTEPRRGQPRRGGLHRRHVRRLLMPPPARARAEAWRLSGSVSLRPEPFGALVYHFGTRRLSFLKTPELVDGRRPAGRRADVGDALAAAGVPDGQRPAYLARPRPASPTGGTDPRGDADDASSRTAPHRRPSRLVDQFEHGLDAPICLTWELTYACNLACVHCLTSSGRRDPDELTTAEAKAVIDEFERMQVFYVNIGGGEPTVRPDFWELLDYAVDHHVGVKFSTNGFRITPERAAKLAATDYVDVQISLDGATAEVNDAVRGAGSYDAAMRAMANLPGRRHAATSRSRSSAPGTTSASSTSSRRSPTATAPSCGSPGCARPAAAPTCGTSCTRCPEQQRELYDWLVANGDQVLTGDSFFHLSALRRGAARAEPVRRRPGGLPGRPGRRRLRLPVRDPRPVPGRQRRATPGGLRRGVEALASCSPSCAARRPAAPAPRARRTTPAGAAAWRRSSSPACRSTAPTRSA